MFTLGQNRHRFIPMANKSAYAISSDSTLINFHVADSIAFRMNLKIFKSNPFQHLYYNKTMWFPYMESFRDYRSGVSKTISYKGINYKLNPGDHIYGFTTKGSISGFAARNISNFFMSAYSQEMDKSYRSNHSFINLPSKDEKEFCKRNWISMGYALNYAVKDNPFTNGKGFQVGVAYFWDAFHYYMIFVGPFIGETTKDKIEIPIIGIVSLIIWKKLLLGKSGMQIIKSYNNMVNSKYGIPANLEKINY
jgi:hypothetical protein